MIYEDLIRDTDEEIEANNNVIKLKDKMMLDLNKKMLHVEKTTTFVSPSMLEKRALCF